MTTVEAERNTQQREEEVRALRERIEHLRGRHEQAESDFDAAGKELDAIRTTAAALDADDANWETEFAEARNAVYKARTELEDVAKRLASASPPSRRWFRSA